MDPASGEWKVDRWGPTAPESCVLLDGPKASGAEVFRLAVLESIARRNLSVAGDVDLPDADPPVGVLLAGDRMRPTGERPLDAIQEIFEQIHDRPSRGSGVHVKKLAKATRRRYGSFDGYVKAEVLPALERRGFYERRKSKLLWLLPVTRWELTRSGEAARTQLESNRRLGEQHFGEWLRRDPQQAYGFLGLAGSSLLLMEALHPELRDLQDLEDDHDNDVVYPPVPPGAAGDADLDALPDLGGAISVMDSWTDGAWGDGAGSGGGGWFDGGGGNGSDGGAGGFDGGGGGGF